MTLEKINKHEKKIASPAPPSEMNTLEHDYATVLESMQTDIIQHKRRLEEIHELLSMEESSPNFKEIGEFRLEMAELFQELHVTNERMEILEEQVQNINLNLDRQQREILKLTTTNVTLTEFSANQHEDMRLYKPSLMIIGGFVILLVFYALWTML